MSDDDEDIRDKPLITFSPDPPSNMPGYIFEEDQDIRDEGRKAWVLELIIGPEGGIPSGPTGLGPAALIKSLDEIVRWLKSEESTEKVAQLSTRTKPKEV